MLPRPEVTVPSPRGGWSSPRTYIVEHLYYSGSVRRWTRQWRMTVRWARAEDSPWLSTTYQFTATTAAELRRLIAAARADRGVVAFPYESVREMVGEEPTQCPAGHVYRHGRSRGRLIDKWAVCGCGGHHVLVCEEPGCPHPEVLDPPVDYDCDPRIPS